MVLISCLPLRGSSLESLCLSHNYSSLSASERIISSSLLKQVCEYFTLSLNWPVFRFYWLYITVQTALPIKWKLWVSGAELGGQHLAAHFSLGTPRAGTGHKREGWLLQWFQLVVGPRTPSLVTDSFSSVPLCCQIMDSILTYWFQHLVFATTFSILLDGSSKQIVPQ